MRFTETFLVLMALALAACAGTVAAEEVSVGPYTFAVPDGYAVASDTDLVIAMKQDEYNSITFATEISDDIEASKQVLINKGYAFIDEEEMEYSGYNTTLQKFSYKADGTTLYSFNYIELIDSSNFVITLVTDNPDFDGDLNSGENPAAYIFDTLAVN